MAAPDDIVMQQIQDLLNAPTSGAEAPTLARLEDTLTEGYAQALALEAERWRLERRLSEMARALGGEAGPTVALELSTLSDRLSDTDGELSRLRGLLGSLHDRTRSARTPSR
ncbi:MAG: hypothetical protein ACYDCH_11450 [Gaiellaceae bacterium]